MQMPEARKAQNNIANAHLLRYNANSFGTKDKGGGYNAGRGDF